MINPVIYPLSNQLWAFTTVITPQEAATLSRWDNTEVVNYTQLVADTDTRTREQREWDQIQWLTRQEKAKKENKLDMTV